MDHIQALRTIAEYPVAEQDDMPAVNMRKIAIEALERIRSAGEAGEYPPLPARFHTVYDDIDGETVPCFSDNQMRAYVDADRAARAQAPAAVEPVTIYHGRCTIDCGDHGHHDMEMLKLIPTGSKLYTAPTTKAEPTRQFTDGTRTLRQDCISAVRDFASSSPEDGEPWESWFEAAFDLLASRIGIIFDEHATKAEPAPTSDGWLQDGDLLYRLTDDPRPYNRDEIQVTMADGSRITESRTRRAGELLDMIRSPKASPADALDVNHTMGCRANAFGACTCGADVRQAQANANALDAKRFRAIFGAAIAYDDAFIDLFNIIVPENDDAVTLDLIREAIDAAMAAQQTQGGE